MNRVEIIEDYLEKLISEVVTINFKNEEDVKSFFCQQCKINKNM